MIAAVLAGLNASGEKLQHLSEAARDGHAATSTGKHLAAIGLLQVRSRAPTTAMLSQVVRAHREETLGMEPVSFTATGPAIEAWVQAQRGQQLELPAFEQQGYHLLGARTEPAITPHAITLVYEGAHGLLTCTVLPGPTSFPDRLVRLVVQPDVQKQLVQGTWVASAGDTDATYLLAGDFEPATLVQLARLAVRSR